MAHEREIAEEQDFLDRAYEALASMKFDAQDMRDGVAVAHLKGQGNLVERDVAMSRALRRMDQLEVGDAPLFFGRLDYPPASDGGPTVFRIGRLAVTDDHLEPLIVDWRAPIAEAFYRATAVEPFGLSRRRHVSLRSREVVSVEDEYFTDADGELHLADEGTASLTEEGLVDGGLALGGPAALLAALGRARTGRMGDIVSTIQREQDEIIRAPLNGILLVQGGPGTGKTAVALHRAAYLLYTHRFSLEQQGVLVVGPNPLFLNYIGNVLPSLGESGVTMSTVSGLVKGITVRGTEPDAVAQLKGDVRMARVIARAVATRQRPLRKSITIPFGRGSVVVEPHDTEVVVDRARRRGGNHNSRRSAVGRELAHRLADQFRDRYRISRDVVGEHDFGTNLEDSIRALPEFKQVLQRIWPRLTGQELLHDLFGSPALLRLATKGVLDEAETELLLRERSTSMDEIPWTDADLALIDEARQILGPRKRPKSPHLVTDSALEASVTEGFAPEYQAAARREAQAVAYRVDREYDEAEIQTFGHIVVDEAQDLSAMQLRALKRRDHAGSMTIVGDMAQATTAAAAASWAATLEILEPLKPPLRVDLSVSYRTPEEVLAFAAPTLTAAMPDLAQPVPVRRAGTSPRTIHAVEFDATLVETVKEEMTAVTGGRLAVIVTTTRVGEILATLRAGGVDAVDPDHDAERDLSSDVVVIAAEGANGLEFDGVVVVEPWEIASRGSSRGAITPRGLRTLYVSLTRPTRRLAVVHAQDLPPTLR